MDSATAKDSGKAGSVGRSLADLVHALSVLVAELHTWLDISARTGAVLVRTTNHSLGFRSHMHCELVQLRWHCTWTRQF